MSANTINAHIEKGYSLGFRKNVIKGSVHPPRFISFYNKKIILPFVAYTGSFIFTNPGSGEGGIGGYTVRHSSNFTNSSL